MARVPNSEHPEREAKRFLDGFDDGVAAIERRNYVYAWTTRDDEFSKDAIIVRIGGTSAEMLMAGLYYIEPRASICWCARVTANGIFGAGGEHGSWNVCKALMRAHFLRQRMGYERVVVKMAERGIWRPEYGRLAPREGYS